MNSLVETLRSVIKGNHKSWVLFKNGTCVILMDPAADLSAQAVGLMQEWGPVHAGSSAGDFEIYYFDDVPGWVVSSHHNDIFTYVAPEEISEPEPSDLLIGLFGRKKRDDDARELQIVHVEDKRPSR
jgi:hypothetical protein